MKLTAADTGMRASHTSEILLYGANMGVCVIFTWPKPYFNVHALIFYVCEGSSQAIKHAKKYGSNIFEYEGHDL